LIVLACGEPSSTRRRHHPIHPIHPIHADPTHKERLDIGVFQFLGSHGTTRPTALPNGAVRSGSSRNTLARAPESKVGQAAKSALTIGALIARR